MIHGIGHGPNGNGTRSDTALGSTDPSSGLISVIASVLVSDCPRPPMTRRARRLPSISLIAFLVATAVVLVGCDSGPSPDGSSGSGGEFSLDNCTIPTDRLVDGGVQKDGIPALTNPDLTEPGSESAAYLAASDRVIGVLFGETALAIPHNILWHHEIANFDDWEGETFAVTYCPLTGSSLAFDRAAAQGAEFGVSGILFDNNLVMYDRNSEESLWPQMNRQSNCGAATGTALDMLPVVEMTWGQWRELHPDTKVVSDRTGHNRIYSTRGYPYGNYEEEDNPRLLFDMPIDERRPPKERVLGIPTGSGGGVALPFNALDADGSARVVTVAAGGTERTVFWSRDAQSAMAFETNDTFSVENGRIVDGETGSVWTVDGRAVEGPRSGEQLAPVNEAYVAFWFAWAAFQPETTIWNPSSS